MKVKRFDLPNFEEWEQSERDIRRDLGAYRVEIRAVVWGPQTIVYKFAVALSNRNPCNVYVEKLFCRHFNFDEVKNNVEQLKEWYHAAVEEFHTFWEHLIMSTYIETD